MLFGCWVAALFLGVGYIGVDASGLVQRNRAFNIDTAAAESRSFNLSSQHAFGQLLPAEAAKMGDSGPGALLCPNGVCADVRLHLLPPLSVQRLTTSNRHPVCAQSLSTHAYADRNERLRHQWKVRFQARELWAGQLHKQLQCSRNVWPSECHWKRALWHEPVLLLFGLVRIQGSQLLRLARSRRGRH